MLFFPGNSQIIGTCPPKRGAVDLEQPVNQLSKKWASSLLRAEGQILCTFHFFWSQTTFLNLAPTLPHVVSMLLWLQLISLFFSFVFRLEYCPNSSSPRRMPPSLPDGLQSCWLHVTVPTSSNVHHPFSAPKTLPRIFKDSLSPKDVLSVSTLLPYRLEVLRCPVCPFISYTDLVLYRE